MILIVILKIEDNAYVNKVGSRKVCLSPSFKTIFHLNICSVNENSIKPQQFGILPGKKQAKYNGKSE